MPDNETRPAYEPGAELLPDWNNTTVKDEREPEGDPHDNEKGDE